MSRPSPASEHGSGQGDDLPGPCIASLRQRGAQHFDPPRFHYIEALSRRAAAHEGDVKQVLDGKLAQALSAYRARFEQASSEAEQTVGSLVRRFPDAADGLSRLLAGGDFSALRRQAAQLEAQHRDRPLQHLVEHIDRLAATQEGGAAGEAAARPSANTAPAELKTLRHFRKTWTSLSVDRQLSRSQKKVPENPGPLNSHLLVLRSLELMQEISPAYLERYMSHVESLLWLDQASFGGLPQPGKTVLRPNEKKRKTGRGKSG